MHVPVEQKPFYVSPAPPSPKFHWQSPPKLSPLYHEMTRLHADTKKQVTQISNDKTQGLFIIQRADRTHRCSPVVADLPAVCLSGCWAELLEMTADWLSWGSRRTKHWLIDLFQRSMGLCVCKTHTNMKCKYDMLCATTYYFHLAQFVVKFVVKYTFCGV